MDLTTNTTERLQDMQGAFVESLVRNNSKIREDRAIAIVEMAEVFLKRKVEDLATELKRVKRERDNMLDLSPTDANSLVMASDFDAPNFMEKYLALGLKVRDLKIKLEIATESYSHLFTPKA